MVSGIPPFIVFLFKIFNFIFFNTREGGGAIWIKIKAGINVHKLSN